MQDFCEQWRHSLLPACRLLPVVLFLEIKNIMYCAVLLIHQISFQETLQYLNWAYIPHTGNAFLHIRRKHPGRRNDTVGQSLQDTYM